MRISRYPNDRSATSRLDHAEDMAAILSYLHSIDFVVSILRKTHGYTASESRQRAKKIVPHASSALAYLSQVKTSPSEVAFLPAYYAILSLAKTCILFGPYAKQFTHHSRWHGATYAVQAKDSRNIMTETITLQEGGALALYFKTLTDNSIVGRKSIRIGNLWPAIADIGAEYSIATGSYGDFVGIEFSSRINDGALTTRATIRTELPLRFSIRNVPALRGFRKVGADQTVFEKYVGKFDLDDPDLAARSAIDTRYLYETGEHASLVEI